MRFQNPSWLFKSPGQIPDGVITEFYDLILLMGSQSDSYQQVLEDFKSYFLHGKSTSWSSDVGWAQTDLYTYMNEAAVNAPRFIAAFVSGCFQLTKAGLAAPEIDFINEILTKHGVEYQVQGNTVVASSAASAAASPTPSPAGSPKAATATPSAKPAKKLRVFLCHSSGDKPAVQTLYERLKSDGFSPWLDKEDLLPGQDWDAAIKQAVKDAHVVIVCLSQTATSKAGYAQKEIVFALDIADEQPEETIFIIPARLEECVVPKRLNKWHWVDLFTGDGYDKLVKSLKTRAGNLK